VTRVVFHHAQVGIGFADIAEANVVDITSAVF